MPAGTRESSGSAHCLIKQGCLEGEDSCVGAMPGSWHAERIAEIKRRYGPGHLVTRFVTEAAPDLLAAVVRTEVSARVGC